MPMAIGEINGQEIFKWFPKAFDFIVLFERRVQDRSKEITDAIIEDAGGLFGLFS